MPPYPLLPGFLGSDAKVLSASVPVRLGLDACDAARAGLRGLPDILEHPDGFLAKFATVPLPDAVTAGLGTRWHTETLSFKVHPGGPGVDAAVDCARRLHARLGSVRPDDVEEVVVDTSMYTVVVDERVKAYLDGADSPVSALVFATAYAVATTLLNGDLVGADFARPALAEEDRWELSRRVRLEHDTAMTRESLVCEVPFGEAIRQGGSRSAAWLDEVGTQWLVDLVGEPLPPSATFETAEKATPARITVRLRDGSELVEEQRIPVGAIGAETRAGHAGLVREKFLSTGGSEKVADLAFALREASAGDVRLLLEDGLDIG